MLTPHAAIRRACSGACVLLAAFALCPRAHASEAGGHNVATGAETNAPAFMPPRGETELYGYILWLNANSSRDNAGRSTVPGFRADLYANAMQLVHTWKKPWRGFDVSSAAVYIADYAKVKTSSSRDENGDLSDLSFQPIMLTRAWGDFHWLFGSIIYYPVGKYEPKDPANATTHYGHYMSFIAQVAMTWMPNNWFEFSLQPCWAVNMRNHRTGYKSGAMETLDWGTTVRPFPALRDFGLGLGGFYAHQYTDDTQNGVTVPGKRLTKNAFGPQFIYNISPGTAVIVKYQHETHAVNTGRANLVWIEFAIPVHF